MEKKTLRRLVIVTAIVAVVALGLAGVIGMLWGPLPVGGFQRPGRGQVSVDEQESIEIAGLERLVIEAVSEDVRIRPGAGPAVSLRLHGSFHAADRAAVPHLAVSREGGLATARIERQILALAGWQFAELVLEIEVPREYRGELSARNVSGRIELGDMSLGRLALASTSGDLKTGRIHTGHLSLATVSGEITVGGANARTTDFSSTSGAVRIDALSGSLRGETVSGDLRLAFAAAPGAARLQSTSGEVSLRLPGSSAFRLEARSTSGEVTCKLPIQLDEYPGGAGRGAGGNVLVGTVGGGGERVDIQTVSGDIRILD